MAYDRAYLVGRVQDRLGDDGDDEDIISYIQTALNDVQAELCTTYKFTFMQDSSTVTLAADAQTTARPATCLRATGLRIIAPTSPTNYRRDISDNYMRYNEFRAKFPYIDGTIDTKGAPFQWTTFGNNFQFDRVADQSYTLAVDFIKKPTKMTADGDTPLIPEEFEEIYVLGAIMRLMKREDDYAPKSQEQGDYDKRVLQLVQNYGIGTEPLQPKRMPAAFRR